MEGPATDETSTPLPRQLGAYLLVKQLGRGGMGHVFLAVQRLEIFERPCVIKLIRGRLVGHDVHRRRFLDEARTTLSLSHRNVSRVLDVGAEDGTIYLAMEYVAGRDLRSVLKRCIERGERLPPAIAVFILAELLDALEAAHSNVDAVTGAPLSIVHRDVSPHNVMIGFDGGVKLIDFGVASSAAATTQTDPGLVVGKTTYMAPEQAAGEPVGGGADVFATAVLGVELFSSARFYGSKAVDEIAEALEECRYRPPSFVELPAPVRAAFDAALSRAPTARPSAGALAATLRAWATAEGQVAGAAELRALLSALFPGEETAERRVHQDLMRTAHEIADSIDSTQTGSRDASTPTSLDRRPRAQAAASEVPFTHTPAPPRSRVRMAQLGLAAVTAVAIAFGIATYRNAAAREEGAPASAAAAAAYQAGIAHMRALEFVAARTRLEKAAALEPGHAMCHVRLAQLLFHGGQLLDAKVAALRAWDLRDGLATREHDLVEAVRAEAMRDWPTAVDALSRRAAARDASADDFLELARVQISAGRSTDALQTLSRARQHRDAARALSLILLLESDAARSSGDLDRALVAARAARADAEGRGSEALVANATLAEGVALQAIGSTEQARARLEEARERFKALGDRGAHAAALLALGAVTDPGRADAQPVAMFEEALAMFREVRDLEGEALALNNLAATSEGSADRQSHRQLLRRALAISREIDDHAAIATTALNLGMTLAFDGELAAGAQLLTDALAAARVTLNALDIAWALAALAQTESMRGDLAAARLHIDEASALVRGASATEAGVFVTLVRADVLLVSGAVAEAIAVFGGVEDAQIHGLHGWAVVGAVRARIEAGERPPLAGLLEVAETGSELASDLELHVVTGTAQLLAGDRAAAEQALARARAVIARQPDLTLRGTADELDARLRAARGDRAGAQRLLIKAAQEARALGALPTAVQLELALAELGDPSHLAAARADAERMGASALLARAVKLARR